MIRDASFSLLTCRCSRVDATWRAQQVVDDEGRLYLPLAGRAWLDAGQGREELVPGRAVLVPPDRPRSYDCDRFLELLWLHFRAVDREGMGLFTRLGCVTGLELGDPGDWHRRFDRLQALHRLAGPAATLEADGLLRQLLAPFLRDGPRQDGELERLRAAMAMAEAHLDRPLAVAGLARAAGWSPAHFSRRFRHRLGLAPMAWVRGRRLARARELLAATRLPLAAIAERTGFVDGFHLSKVFKANAGVSPSAWRRRVSVVP